MIAKLAKLPEDFSLFEMIKGSFDGEPRYATEVAPGFYTACSHGHDIRLWGRNDWERTSPGLWKNGGPYDYGVVDTPRQFFEQFGEFIHRDPRPLIVMFTHVAKEPENKGKGGGWRWHKWGDYVGAGEPTTEYLDDEDAFDDGIYCFSVMIVDNLEHTIVPIEEVKFAS